MGDFLRWLFINPLEPTALPRDEPMSALNPLATLCQQRKQSMLGRLGTTWINQACRGLAVYFGYKEGVCINQAQVFIPIFSMQNYVIWYFCSAFCH